MKCECIYNHGAHPDGTCKGCGFEAPKRNARPVTPARVPAAAQPSVPPGYYDEHEAGKFTIERGKP